MQGARAIGTCVERRVENWLEQVDDLEGAVEELEGEHEDDDVTKIPSSQETALN